MIDDDNDDFFDNLKEDKERKPKLRICTSAPCIWQKSPPILMYDVIEDLFICPMCETEYKP